ncbi:hypothetical protein [Streptomyces sp. NPDC059861]|uniref:hypothetical protein n=1 Tax=Streptomyces sp. NPDC059861 TaxID=3346974 RepID=UPI003646E67A
MLRDQRGVLRHAVDFGGLDLRDSGRIRRHRRRAAAGRGVDITPEQHPLGRDGTVDSRLWILGPRRPQADPHARPRPPPPSACPGAGARPGPDPPPPAPTWSIPAQPTPPIAVSVL